MAAYTQNISAADLDEAVLNFCNTVDKKVFKDIFGLIITEYAAMATAGLAAYTVTTTLNAALLQKLDNLNDNRRVEVMTDIITQLIAEFTSVATNGLSYSITTGFLATLKESVEYYNNVIDRVVLHDVFDLLNAEQVLLAAAS